MVCHNEGYFPYKTSQSTQRHNYHDIRLHFLSHLGDSTLNWCQQLLLDQYLLADEGKRSTRRDLFVDIVGSQ